ncbi:MAG: alpha-galactosidase [Firmicutes bacterium]|nr:alpha-galactosidase [Bacillota bacterium]
MKDLYLQLLITYTDGCQSVIPLDCGTEKLSDRYVSAAFCWSDIAGGKELAITVRALEPKPIRFIDVKAALPPDMYGDDTLVFMSGYTTNDVASCRRLADVRFEKSRDNILYKGGGRLLGAAFTSADRFFTYICLEDRWFLMRHSMENKRLLAEEEYRLEGMMLCFPESTESFFELYTNMLVRHYDIPALNIPTGWCSWSCYYSLVNEPKVRTAHLELCRYYDEKHTNTVQIDDGWQSGGSFSGFWEPDKNKFPGPLSDMARDFRKDKMTLGLWLAPLLASRSSGFFVSHPELKHTAHEPYEPEHSYMCGEDPVYTLDIGQKETVDYIRGVFERCNREYGAEYFKLDFMVFALHRLSGREQFLIYREDYATAIYRRVIRAIREAVGDSFLLACGSPIAESVGVFNGIRVTPDIIWCKSKSSPTAWELIKMCTNSIACRYFYNGKVFVNDPDGLVVRDFDFDDGFDVTYQEAKTWATSVAMSGGSSLINEQMERIGSARRELFSQILPPLGVAARPVDFFQQPQPTKLQIKNPDGSVIVALYNLSDRVEDLELDLKRVGITGEAICMRTWTKSIIGPIRDKLVFENAIGHSAEVFVIVPLGREPRFAFAACNLYGGAGIYDWEFKRNRLSIIAGSKLSRCSDNRYYVFLPSGYDLPGAQEAARFDSGRLVCMNAVSGMTDVFELVKPKK